MDINDFVQGYSDITITYYNDGWIESIHEVLNDNGTMRSFTFNLTNP